MQAAESVGCEYVRWCTQETERGEFVPFFAAATARECAPGCDRSEWGERRSDGSEENNSRRKHGGRNSGGEQQQHIFGAHSMPARNVNERVSELIIDEYE